MKVLDFVKKLYRDYITSILPGVVEITTPLQTPESLPTSQPIFSFMESHLLSSNIDRKILAVHTKNPFHVFLLESSVSLKVINFSFEHHTLMTIHKHVSVMIRDSHHKSYYPASEDR